MGHEIARKAEDEQAVTIYWMLVHYLKDPDNWRDNAMAETIESHRLRHLMYDKALIIRGFVVSGVWKSSPPSVDRLRDLAQAAIESSPKCAHGLKRLNL
jgi:hypothetical protein